MADPEERHSHPGVRQYVEIGVILAAITALEVALYYVDLARQVTVPSLLVLTAVKFALVVLWFMHLRFDSKWFRRLFLTGFALAALVFGITVTIQYFGNTGNV